MQHIGLRRQTEDGKRLAEFNDGNGIDLRIAQNKHLLALH
jgi:hypothetical protein